MIDKAKWKNIEKNIWQNIENPKKLMVILYYGRDARGRMKKSSKTMYGTLTEARNMLKQHDVDRLHEVNIISIRSPLGFSANSINSLPSPRNNPTPWIHGSVFGLFDCL